MRVFEIRDDWSIDHIRPGQRPRPVPGPGQVLLRMKAASLNYRDLVVPRRGYGRQTGELPLIPVSDGVGEVVETAPGVDRVRVGERVCPVLMRRWISGPPSRERLRDNLGGPLDGVMAEYMAVDAEAVCRVPDHLSDVEAATLPCAALTAWSAVVTEGRLGPGDTVLIHGTGGVALFALQFARLAGARIIVTTSSAEKMERVRALGASHALNYREDAEWSRAVKALTGGDGVDLVVELGGASTLEQSLRAVRVGGTLAMIGVLGGGEAELPLGLVVTRHVRMQGVTLGNRDGFEAMCRAIGEHRLVPVVDRVFGFDELREALDYMAEGRHFGKICLRFPDA
jgi:NADPH:quinone reductase-like Zn-dependent oxidoreductase